MRPFEFCPACATPVENTDDPDELHCPGCDRDWYSNMAPTAGAAIVRNGRALATVRAREPEKGKLDVPGGFLGPDEHPIEGLKREVSEELGIEIEASVSDCVQMVPHAYGADGQVVLSLGFVVRWVSGEPVAADDVAEVRWLTSDDLVDADFAWEHDRDLLRRALADAEG